MRRAISFVLIAGISACASSAPEGPSSPVGSSSAAPSTSAEPSASVAPSASSEASAPVSSASAAPASSSAPAAEPGPLDPPPLEVDYPLKGLTVLPDDCKEPSVVLTTAPKSMGWDYDWIWTRQAMHANPQFAILDWPGRPEKPMQVRLDMYAIPAGFALVGVCKDAATCNKLAAMYRATVPTCDPRLACGPLAMEGPAKRSAIIPANGEWLPVDAKSVVGRCARIGVCMKMLHEPFKGNPGVQCQNSPAKFKTDCAKKATCEEVVACLR